MLTEKDYCDYETCVALKELGYEGTSGECSHFGAFHMNGKEIFYDRLYNSELKENECLRVPLYLAQKWLREEKGKHIEINLQFLSEEKRWYWGFTILYFDNPHLVSINGDYSSYEETLSEGIKEAVKILKEKDND